MSRENGEGVGSAVRATAGRALGLRLGAVGAIIGVMGLLTLAPFAVKGGENVASCEPVIAGRGEDASAAAPLRAMQVAFAKLIDEVAVARGLPGQATLVALMTALQESQLQNLGYGDLDSLGLFQQRPAAGWGTPAQLQDPRYAVEAFFGGAKPPSPPGLVDIDGWTSMPYTEAAQAVQVSAFPDAYAKHEQTAKDIASQAGIDLNRSGDPYAGRAGTRPTNAGVGAVLDACGRSVLAGGKPVNGRWPEEVASVTDPTGTGGKVTPRMAAWVAAGRLELALKGVSCWDRHAWNPTSDHPRGRACDVMVGGDARKSPALRAMGDRIANWTIQNAARNGVNYVIWYGQIWSSRTGAWRAYNGGGVYNPSDANGGHFNHVHVSMH